ncbi:MFS transporter [Mobilicoccus sp.]|uniref:MFS transporter n=1 Tax=Mobilicoccus sp. TaxID=2034349 RepID=UPI0028A12EE4|nr:MFS transporter [Mobilicoccus sp.]
MEHDPQSTGHPPARAADSAASGVRPPGGRSVAGPAPVTPSAPEDLRRSRRRARFGISLMFFTNGIIFAMLLPRYPELKAAMGLSNTQFGVTVIAFPAGAILAAGLAGPLVRRYGTGVLMGVGTALIAGFVFLAGTSSTAAVFAVALLVAGFVDAIVDAAQNIQGALVEQWAERSIINSLHAVWSLGAATGGLLGAWSAGAQIPIGVMLGVNGLVWSGAAVLAAVLSRVPLTVMPTGDTGDAGGTAQGGVDEGEDVATDSRVGSRPWRLLLPLIVLAICGTLLEEVASSWAALYMGEVLQAGAGVAGLGYSVMLAAQFVGRVTGDPMTDRWGRVAVARAGAVTIVVGAVTLVVAPSIAVGLLGLTLMGFGCATLVPAAYAAAARLPGFPHGTGVALLSWLMRLGFLGTSPIIGLIADHSGLRTAMTVPLVAGLVAAAITHRLAAARRVRPSPSTR